MDIGSILLVLALLILVGLFVARPLFDTKMAASDETSAARQEHNRSSLLAERDRVLTALEELDFDYSLGKIPEEDYPSQRARLLEYGAGVLRSLDELDGATATGVGDTRSAEDRIEATIATRRADNTIGPVVTSVNGGKTGNGGRGIAPGQPDDDIEAMLANRRRARQEKSSGFCAKCGKPLQQSDKFCPKCGVKIG